MPSPIICVTNTFPFKGEQFLKTELELVDVGVPITLWTFLPPKPESVPLIHRETIKMCVYCEEKLGKKSKLEAALSSVRSLFRNHEIIAALRKKGKIRNLVKAIKFGYISELRVAQIADWIRKTYGNDPRVVFYSYWMYEVAYVSARLKQLFPKCKFVTRCHRFDLYESQHANGYLPYRHFILDSADIIFPISNDAKNYLNALYNNEYDQKIEVARIGSIRDFDVADPKRHEKIIVVSCSNMIPVKRVHLIAETLRKTDLDIEWYHFGDGETRRDVEKIIEQYPENVKAHLMGFTPNKEIQEFFSSHEITALINASQSEGVPVSIMEAQSYGIPIIATDVGGTSEIVHDRENGVLLAVDFTDQDLLDAIDDVLSHEREYSENAIRTWEAMSNARVVYPAFYKRLAEV